MLDIYIVIVNSINDVFLVWSHVMRVNDNMFSWCGPFQSCMWCACSILFEGIHELMRFNCFYTIVALLAAVMGIRLGKFFLLYSQILKISPIISKKCTYILNAWPIILMFWGSKVGIKGTDS